MQLAVLSDLHDDAAYVDIFTHLQRASCLLVVGDIANRYRQTYQNGLAFMREVSKLMPTFFSIGNHELRIAYPLQLLNALRQAGVHVLLNEYIRFQDIWIGGWYSPRHLLLPDMLDEFEQLSGAKVLMCHKPHHYFPYLQGRDIDLVLAGHAHGGQIRIGNRGLYSPGQGFFPRYTKGVVDDRMIISTGASNSTIFPRWNNPCEVLRINLT